MNTPQLPPCSYQPKAYRGPSAEEVLALRKQFVNPGIFHMYKKPIMLVEGKGQFVWDENGRRYLDGLGGIVTVSVGHCHPHVVEAVRGRTRRSSIHDHLSAPEHRASMRRSSPRRCPAT